MCSTQCTVQFKVHISFKLLFGILRLLDRQLTRTTRGIKFLNLESYSRATVELPVPVPTPHPGPKHRSAIKKSQTSKSPIPGPRPFLPKTKSLENELEEAYR